MNHGSLFSGIGGFDLAAERMGWNNVFHCENNSFCNRILKHYWPKSESYGDIKTTDFTVHMGKIDVLTGGFPCQPYSIAGKRLGKDDQRHLWPEMLRAIREIQPGYIVGENVRGILSWNSGLVFHEVQTELEIEDYEVLPFLLPACAVNAPHRRDRIWFIANRKIKSGLQGTKTVDKWKKHILSDWDGIRNPSFPDGEIGIAPDTDNAGTWNKCAIDGNGTQENIGREKFAQSEFGENGEIDSHTDNDRLQGRQDNGNITEIREREKQQFGGFFQSDFKKFPTESPICNGDDGISFKLDGIAVSKWIEQSIRAGGNSIVPNLALMIFKAIEKTNSHERNY